ncbi:hypothetical protein MSAN_00495400 [Mycena sanguinolenta]|uniref:Uncharacterized protein n=1 Tax=Mycena sanguinolenta TaxID=230812 RepID=A0A8H6U3M2_9AGAR|nr:hypothetical protein MSAN_02491800 [Mycena sanguinolenta]KAF7372892.1 hypothetical protein MSAN_00495400 [Mycena sanguinolenta]
MVLVPHHLANSPHLATMMKITASFAILAALAVNVGAICPGFNYGIGNVISEGNGINRWNVYDDSCNVVDGLTTNQNPCDEGIFGCSGPPVIFDQYTNSFNGLVYACRTDPNSGTCGSDVISVCCRNDGN